jgi:hypothetical protein
MTEVKVKCLVFYKFSDSIGERINKLALKNAGFPSETSLRKVEQKQEKHAFD